MPYLSLVLLKNSHSLFYLLFLAFTSVYIFCLFGWFWLRWVFVAARGLSLRCGVRASHCNGFSCCGARALGMRASVAVARELSSCGARAYLLCGMRDLPGPGLEPVSPALTDGFLTTAPPGKPHIYIYK